MYGFRLIILKIIEILTAIKQLILKISTHLLKMQILGLSLKIYGGILRVLSIGKLLSLMRVPQYWTKNLKGTS